MAHVRHGTGGTATAAASAPALFLLPNHAPNYPRDNSRKAYRYNNCSKHIRHLLYFHNTPAHLQRAALLIRPYQQVNEQRHKQEGNNRPKTERTVDKQAPNLVNAQ